MVLDADEGRESISSSEGEVGCSMKEDDGVDMVEVDVDEVWRDGMRITDRDYQSIIGVHMHDVVLGRRALSVLTVITLTCGHVLTGPKSCHVIDLILFGQLHSQGDTIGYSDSSLFSSNPFWNSSTISSYYHSLSFYDEISCAIQLQPQDNNSPEVASRDRSLMTQESRKLFQCVACLKPRIAPPPNQACPSRPTCFTTITQTLPRTHIDRKETAIMATQVISSRHIH